MAGRPRGAQARTVYVPVRFTVQGADALDKARGPIDRSTYIRNLVAADAQKKGLA